MRFEVAEIQSTPNPNALKFVLTRTVADQPISFFNAEAAANHPLAAKLFAGSRGIKSFTLKRLHHRQPKAPKPGGRRLRERFERCLQTPEPAATRNRQIDGLIKPI